MKHLLSIAVVAGAAIAMAGQLCEAGVSIGGITGGDRTRPHSMYRSYSHRVRTYAAPMQYYAPMNSTAQVTAPPAPAEDGQTYRSFSNEPGAAGAAPAPAASCCVPAPTCCTPAPTCCAPAPCSN